MRITTPQNDISEVLLSEEQIKQRVKELAKTITEDYKDKMPIVVCVLKGSSFFFVDLCKDIECHINLDFMAVSSYGSSSISSGEIKIKKDLEQDIKGRDVLIVEDIIDSGHTLKKLIALLDERKPKSIKTICLLDKVARRVVDQYADYVGFEIPDEFVVGYGLDFAEYYRNLPYIGILKPEVYE